MMNIHRPDEAEPEMSDAESISSKLERPSRSKNHRQRKQWYTIIAIASGCFVVSKAIYLLCYHDDSLHRNDFVSSHDVASGSELTSCNKIDKPVMVYRLIL